MVKDAQEAERLRRAVLALPHKYRDAVTLYYFHEQSVQDAALSLGVPEGTLKVRLHRGREILRNKFSTGTIPSLGTEAFEKIEKELK